MFDQADRNGQGSHLWPSSEPALVECRTIIKRPRSDICNINSNNNSNPLRPKCRSTISTALGLVAWCLLISFHLRSNGHITSNGNHCRLHQPLAQLALSASLTLVGAASSSSSSPSSTSILQSSIVSTNGGGGDGSSGPSSSLHGGDKRQSSAGQTPSSSSATSIQSDDDAQRWHTVSAYVGGEISMPCAIDVAGCGRIYFITWTKNGSTILAETGSTTSSPKGSISKNGDWQRVFIHSDTFEKVLGDLDQLGPPGRVRFGPKDKLNTTSFAYLTVQSVTSQDEGVYKCDVTYTTPHAHGKCPSLTYTRVQTLVKPSSPKIRVNGRLLNEYRTDNDSPFGNVGSSSSAKPLSDAELMHQRQIGSFEEGSTIVFECSTFGGRPMPELRWYNGSRPLRSKINVIESNRDGSFPSSSSSSSSSSSRSSTDLPEHLVNEVNGNGINGDRNKEMLVATTRIIASRYDLGAKFECRVLWNHSSDYTEDAHWSMHHSRAKLHNTSLLHEWMLLDIKVRPLNIRVDSPRSPVVSGETVMLRCSVDGARPAANITWYNRSEVVQALPLPTPPSITSSSSLSSSGQSLLSPGQPARTRLTNELLSDGTYRSSSILVFSATRADHLADFFCKGSNEVLRNRNEVPLLQGVQLQVLYPPLVAIEPDGIIPVNETSSMQLWCTYDANPTNLTEIVWYKNRVPINFDQWSPDKLWTSKDERGTPILTVNDIDRNDSAEYSCRLRNTFGVSDSITSAKLEVAYPPVVQLDIIQPMSQTVIESNPSSLIALRCTTIQGNPSQLTQVQWYHNGHHFMTTLSVRQLNQLNGVGVINGISNGPNFYRVGMGKHFTLIDESTNTNEQVGPIDGTLLAFNDSTLSQAPYVQYLDSPNLLTISNVSRIHAGNYSCLGFNGAANSSTSSLAKTIFVKYKPGRTVLSLSTGDDYILHGTQAVLECRIEDAGNPRTNLIHWTHNGIRIDRPFIDDSLADITKTREGGLESKIPLIARLRTKVADKSTAGEYGCVAVNELGEGEWSHHRIEVKSPPKLLQPLPATIGAQMNHSITLSCRIECEPMCSVQWFHNNITALSTDARGVFPSSIRNEYRAKLRNGNELRFWIETTEHQAIESQGQYSSTLSRLHILNTSALFDHDQLSCISTENNLGPPAKSSVVFRREFPPHSVQISVPQIDLLEGERYPEKPIQCSAFGNPPPNYYWTFSPVFFNPHVNGGGGQPSEHDSSQHRHPSGGNNKIDDQNVVAIGSLLTLNMSTMGHQHHRAHAQVADARVAHEQSVAFSIPGSTMGPSLFRASRIQSGNYTCVTSNRHGVQSATMSINVFYRPECELRRIHQAKVFRQHSPITFPNGSHSSAPHFDPQLESTHVLISCVATSNPAPMGFSWFRRNGSAMVEIHPSPENDHSLFVAIQDYDYEDDHSVAAAGGPYRPNGHVPYQADQQLHLHGQAHSRQSAVLSVPDYANLEEYACVVNNLIGKSEPCWYQEQPAQGQIQPEQSNWGFLGEDNLLVVAATAGLIVFIVVASGAVVVVVCMHRHRTPIFKGFGNVSNSGSGGGTPQRFKLDRHTVPVSAVHHLLDSSPDLDIEFITGMDSRSKTATLTAGYRMAQAKHGAINSTTGTMGKSYRTLPHHQNPYMSAGVGNGSVYGGSSSNGSATGSRPFLVSYASSNVYAEPEYHCNASNHSGEQLTGSTTVTSASVNPNVNNPLATVNNNQGSLPPLPPTSFNGITPYGADSDNNGEQQSHQKRNDPRTNESKFGQLRDESEIYENNYPTYEELDHNPSKQVTSPYYYQQKVSNIDSIPDSLSKKKIKSHKTRRTKSNSKFYKSHNGSPSSSSLASSAVSSGAEDGGGVDEQSYSRQESITSKQPDIVDFRSSYATSKYGSRPSYLQPHHPSESEDSESTTNSAAYNPERDFYFGAANHNGGDHPTQHHPQSMGNVVSKIYEQLPPSGAATNARMRRMLPSANKYGSLVRQSSASACLSSPGGGGYRTQFHQPPPTQPHQYQASPISTRIYFNFADSQSVTNGTIGNQQQQQQQQQSYNSLRYGPNHNARTGTGKQLNGQTRRGSSPQPNSMLRTFNNVNNSNPTTNGRNVTSTSISTNADYEHDSTPPEYHRVFNE